MLASYTIFNEKWPNKQLTSKNQKANNLLAHFEFACAL